MCRKDRNGRRERGSGIRNKGRNREEVIRRGKEGKDREGLKTYRERVGMDEGREA